MAETQFADEYNDVAEFYDGLEEHPGTSYPSVFEDAALGLPGVGFLINPPAPAPMRPLLTPEEFMAKHNLGAK